MPASLTNPDLPSPPRARVSADVSARLRANPRVTRLPIEAADVYHMADFVTEAECATLCALIDAGRRPSTLLTTPAANDFRTSESCDLHRHAPEVRAIDERIADLLGIDPAHGETVQGQRYAPGQQFRAHHDYFQASQPYWPRMQAEGGQRTWTAMIYLSEVEEGGATWFPQAGVRVPPRPRLLLVWNNMRPDGAPNPTTLHEGTAVTAGTKYIVTKWFREGPWVR